MAESYTGEAYCVKCKEKRDFTGEVKVSALRPPHGAGHLPRLRHQAQPDPRQGLSHTHAPPDGAVVTRRPLRPWRSGPARSSGDGRAVAQRPCGRRAPLHSRPRPQARRHAELTAPRVARCSSPALRPRLARPGPRSSSGSSRATPSSCAASTPATPRFLLEPRRHACDRSAALLSAPSSGSRAATAARLLVDCLDEARRSRRRRQPTRAARPRSTRSTATGSPPTSPRCRSLAPARQRGSAPGRRTAAAHACVEVRGAGRVGAAVDRAARCSRRRHGVGRPTTRPLRAGGPRARRAAGRAGLGRPPPRRRRGRRRPPHGAPSVRPGHRASRPTSSCSPPTPVDRPRPTATRLLGTGDPAPARDGPRDDGDRRAARASRASPRACAASTCTAPTATPTGRSSLAQLARRPPTGRGGQRRGRGLRRASSPRCAAALAAPHGARLRSTAAGRAERSATASTSSPARRTPPAPGGRPRTAYALPSAAAAARWAAGTTMTQVTDLPRRAVTRTRQAGERCPLGFAGRTALGPGQAGRRPARRGGHRRDPARAPPSRSSGCSASSRAAP